MAVFLRRVLLEKGVKNAGDYNLNVPTKESLALLVNYFDMNCTIDGNFMMFQEIKFFILENNSGQILFGCFEDHNQTKE